MEPELIVPDEPESKKAWDEDILIYGLHYKLWHFPKAGCRIRPHSHSSFEHTTQLLRGEFVVYGDGEGREGKRLKAFDTVVFRKGAEHSIIALTDNALCMHFYPPGTFVSNGG